jgi:hypothetical protein
MVMACQLQRDLITPALRDHLFAAQSMGEVEMLSQCANSQCSKPFLRLREGKLFLVETGHPEKLGQAKADVVYHTRDMQPHVERFWLCDQCATHWTLIYDRERGVLLAPLRKPVASVPVPAEFSRGATA